MGGSKMGKDLTFDELTHLVGATVVSCDFDGNAVEEYVKTTLQQLLYDDGSVE